MSCNCAVVNLILGAVIFVLAVVPTGTLFSVDATLWVIVIASALLLIHSVVHGACQRCGAAPARRRGRR